MPSLPSKAASVRPDLYQLDFSELQPLSAWGSTSERLHASCSRDSRTTYSASVSVEADQTPQWEGNFDFTSKQSQQPSLPSINEEYLHPTLAKNESERVKSLWYLTELIKDNASLKKHFREILNLVRLATGYPGAFIGLLDVDAFVEMEAADRERCTYPRRETICAHTVQEEPGTVLELSDFENHPLHGKSLFVTKAGLKSYAGTQLYYTDTEGQTTVLGTLCVNSTVKMQPLSEPQKKMLLGLANLAMSAITTEARSNRQHSSAQMQTLLVELSVLLELANNSPDELSAEDKSSMAISALESVFPGCKCSIVTATEGIKLDGHSEVVPLQSFQERTFYENQAAFDEYFLKRNHLPASEENHKGITYRAIIYKVGEERDEYLCVESQDMKRIFDDTDALFLRSVGLTLYSHEKEKTKGQVDGLAKHFDISLGARPKSPGGENGKSLQQNSQGNSNTPLGSPKGILKRNGSR